MFERFSDEARRTVVRALVEARLLGHDYVGTEHALIALATHGQSSSALAAQGVTVERVRSTVAEIAESGTASIAWDDGPYTARARHTFELGQHEAFGLDHHYVANSHLLLGLLRLGQGNGIRALDAMGVDLAALRHTVAEILESDGPPLPPSERRSVIGTGQRLAIKQPHEVDLRATTPPPAAPPGDGREQAAPGPPARQGGNGTHVTEAASANGHAAPAPGSPAAGSEHAPVEHACSFCETPLDHGDRFIAGATSRICVECVRASARLLGVMDVLQQDFTLVFDGRQRTATLSLGMSAPATSATSVGSNG